jgi:hypothetical protein
MRYLITTAALLALALALALSIGLSSASASTSSQRCITIGKGGHAAMIFVGKLAKTDCYAANAGWRGHVVTRPLAGRFGMPRCDFYSYSQSTMLAILARGPLGRVLCTTLTPKLRRNGFTPLKP